MNQPHNDDIIPVVVHQVVASFSDAKAFEDATDAVERSGVNRSLISLVASHDAVKQKFALAKSGAAIDDSKIPQTIFADRHEIDGGRAFAVGMPAYIGGAGAGLAIVATGGALAAAAIVAALGTAAGAGIGTLVARAVSKHHADYLEKQLAMGSLLLTVDAKDPEQEKALIDILTLNGGKDARAIEITRYWDPTLYERAMFSPFMSAGMFVN